jgi:hypothetical protein
MIMGDRKKREKDEVVKSHWSSNMIGGLVEISTVSHVHSTLTTSGSLTSGESNPFRTVITQSLGASKS